MHVFENVIEQLIYHLLIIRAGYFCQIASALG